MLAVILSILKIVGLALLWILGIILALVLILLLCPITYRVEGEGSEGKLSGRAKGTYLLGLVRFGFCYPEPGKPYLKILWMDLLNRKGKKGKKKDKGQENTGTKQAESETADFAASGSSEAAEDVPRLDTDDDVSPASTAASEELSREDAGRENFVDDHAETSEKESEESFGKASRFLKEKVLRLQGKLKRLLQEYHFYQNLLEDEQTQGLLAKGKKRLFRILKSIFPRKIHVEGRFGSGSPDITGYVFGLYTLFAGRFDRDSRLEPDFEDRIMEGLVRAKGAFNLWGIVWNGLCVLLDRRLRLTRKRLKDHKELMEKRKDREEASIAAELAE